jgi:hypothetical protein
VDRDRVLNAQQRHMSRSRRHSERETLPGPQRGPDPGQGDRADLPSVRGRWQVGAAMPPERDEQAGADHLAVNGQRHRSPRQHVPVDCLLDQEAQVLVDLISKPGQVRSGPHPLGHQSA